MGTFLVSSQMINGRVCVGVSGQVSRLEYQFKFCAEIFPEGGIGDSLGHPTTTHKLTETSFGKVGVVHCRDYWDTECVRT